MTATGIYVTSEGERELRERHQELLTRWPVPSERLRIPTREGETFVIASGPPQAPPLLLLHGSSTTCVMWLGDVATWAPHFRVYAVDLIGEPGLSAPSRPPLGSEAYALWLDDVLEGLGLSRVSLVGASLGGWLAVDYAIRRPGRVERLALLSPGGIGRQKAGFAVKALFLLPFGERGRRRLLTMVMGGATPDARLAAYLDYATQISRHFRPRRQRLPVFGDDALGGLTMPVLVILGGRDVMLDSRDTERRMRHLVRHATLRYLPDAPHGLRGHAEPILAFLRDSPVRGTRSAPHPEGTGRRQSDVGPGRAAP
ncbi:alpha/beta fold hydrolase [Microbispora sp. H10836]|uniref:alpha/beta fold hydrolase n=1 Tax=Microbispora sp. H10836 TaxID=2729106 RepID=UPI001473EEF2|nr:alpha/beta fold hydrolase [Microbispora sp. H10836]